MYFLLTFKIVPCRVSSMRARGEVLVSNSIQKRQQPQISGPTKKKMYEKFEQFKLRLER